MFSLKAVLKLLFVLFNKLQKNRLKFMHFRVFLTNEKLLRLLTDPDPDLSLPSPGSSFSDPWQL